MRIAYLVNQYPMTSLTFIKREIRELEKRGFSVQRYALQPWREELVDDTDFDEARKTEYLKQAGILRLVLSVLMIALRAPSKFAFACNTSWLLNQESDRSTLHHVSYLAQACLLAQHLRECECEHLHIHFATNSTEVGLLCRLLGGPSYSFTVHGPEEFDRAASQAYGLKIGHAKFVVAITSYCKSQLYRWADWHDWHKIKIIHCGLDAQMLAAEPTGVGTTPNLVCVGRLCEQKGQLLLIEAMARLKEKGHIPKLKLVGDGPMRAGCERAVQRAGLEDSISITGWATGQQVREAIEEATVFILPSFAEGLPVVIMEAFALGRPVISTFVAGIPELVKPGQNGWLVPAGDVNGLVEAIDEAITTSPQRLNEMGQSGRCAVLRMHSIENEATKLAELISDR